VDRPTGIADEAICNGVRARITEGSVEQALKMLCESAPMALPNYRNWDFKADLVKLVHQTVHRRGYIEEILPALKIMLRDNIGNLQWAVSVTIVMTAYMAVLNIGIARGKDERDRAKRVQKPASREPVVPPAAGLPGTDGVRPEDSTPDNAKAAGHANPDGGGVGSVPAAVPDDDGAGVLLP
jgi:hypothetical protein